MKLFFSPTSPYVRKVLAAAHELGLAGRIERLACAANPINRDASIIASNPLGQVPTLLTDEGTMLADSRVICEYLNEIGGGRLLPNSGAARYEVLTSQSLADGVLTAALLLRYETFMRPEALRWREWIAGQWGKVFSTLDHFEAEAGGYGERVDLGTIALASALSYLDFRTPEVDWRSARPKLAAWYAAYETRPAMAATRLSA